MDGESTTIPVTPTKRGWWRIQIGGAGAAGASAALTRGQLAGLGAIGVLAVALRLYGLSGWPLEDDEAFTYWRSWELDRVNARPLYYLIQRGFLELLPHTALYLRLPAFLFGVAGVAATWALGRRVFGPVAGLVAAFLAAISPWHIYTSQFARYWSLVYLLSALLLWVLPHAVDADRRGPYAAALVLILAGVLSHPSFAFPLVGLVPGLLLVRRSGEVAWRWPSRRGWLLLWGPLIGVALVGFTILAATGNLGAFRNGGSRGLGASLRLIPGVVQWADPAVVAAALAGGGWLLAARADRRWAAMALLGGAACASLLLLASLLTAVYSDYALAALPLLFVTIGGAAQRLGESLEGSGAYAAPAAMLAVLSAGVLPGTVSHLSDGTRHDVRPAYRHVQAELERGRLAPVFGPTPMMQRFYAPRLPFIELRGDSAVLATALRRAGGLWMLTLYQREGIVLASPEEAAWARANCHSVLQTQRPRLDYRVHRVELLWCSRGTAGGEAP